MSKIGNTQWLCGCDNKITIRKNPNSLSRICITQPLQIMPNTFVKTNNLVIRHVEIRHTHGTTNR